MRMLEVFVLKFKTIAKIQLPQILSKWYLIFVKHFCAKYFNPYPANTESD